MKRFLLSIVAMTAMTTLSAQRMLVLYYSETGTTKTVAQELQKQTGADIESIECVEPYSGNFATLPFLYPFSFRNRSNSLEAAATRAVRTP